MLSNAITYDPVGQRAMWELGAKWARAPGGSRAARRAWAPGGNWAPSGPGCQVGAGWPGGPIVLFLHRKVGRSYSFQASPLNSVTADKAFFFFARAFFTR